MLNEHVDACFVCCYVFSARGRDSEVAVSAKKRKQVHALTPLLDLLKGHITLRAHNYLSVLTGRISIKLYANRVLSMCEQDTSACADMTHLYVLI